MVFACWLNILLPLCAVWQNQVRVSLAISLLLKTWPFHCEQYLKSRFIKLQFFFFSAVKSLHPNNVSNCTLLLVCSASKLRTFFEKTFRNKHWTINRWKLQNIAFKRLWRGCHFVYFFHRKVHSLSTLIEFPWKLAHDGGTERCIGKEEKQRVLVSSCITR